MREIKDVIHSISPLRLFAHRSDTVSVELKPVVLPAFEYVPSNLPEVAKVLRAATPITSLRFALLMTACPPALLEKLFFHLAEVDAARLVRHLNLPRTIGGWLWKSDKDGTALGSVLVVGVGYQLDEAHENVVAHGAFGRLAQAAFRLLNPYGLAGMRQFLFIDLPRRREPR